MRHLTLALGASLLLAGTALAQQNKTLSPPKPVTDYKPVQQHLFELNYSVGERNGELTPQLKGAIGQWRKNRNSPATGDMTEAEAAKLLAIPLPKSWATIGYAATGPHIAVAAKPSRDVAEKEAQAACDKDGKKCKLVSAGGTSCAAVATSAGTADGKPMGAWGSYRPTLAAAKEAAAADCKKNAALPDTCAVKEAICADGKR